MKYTRGRAFWNRLSHDESVYCACKVLFLTFITMDITSTKFYSFHSNEIGELVSCNFGFSISLSVILLKLPHEKNYRLRMTDAVPNKKVKDDEPEDPVESMLQKTGCIDLHYKVQVNSSCFHVIKDILRQRLDFLPKKIDFLLIFFLSRSVSLKHKTGESVVTLSLNSDSVCQVIWQNSKRNIQTRNKANFCLFD